MYKQGDGYFWIGGPGEEAFNVPLGLLADKGQGVDHDYLHLHYRSSGTLLAENVLSQYPLNNRARTQLQSFDLDAGQYPAVLERHAEILMVRDQIEALNATTAGRTIIDPNRANVSVIGSYQFAVLARAEMEGCIKALAFADQSIASLQTRLPSYFRKKDAGDTVDAWPLLEARAAVERAKAAGYGAPVP